MSREGHFSVAKALDVLGFDPQVLVSVEVDNHGALQVDALAAQLAADIAQGLSPMCVIGMLGTTATGAIDPLQAIADCARQHDLWFHVDAAAGLALAALPEARALMHGLREADSITFDPCKWMFAAFGVGCLLVRNGELLAGSFWSGGPYWEEKGELDTFKMNLYGTRQFRSLGLWCLLRHLGEQGYRNALRGMTAAAASLREQVQADTRYSLVPDQGLMPVLAFRPQAASDQQVRQLVELCQQRGLGYPSLLDWQGRQYLRVAVSNPDTGVAHMHSFKQGLDGLLGELALLSDQEVQP
jgi:glutamate/tyrosine decarboxylase-like PLP-dependent enzyme